MPQTGMILTKSLLESVDYIGIDAYFLYPMLQHPQ
jgi:hypothetical protein